MSKEVNEYQLASLEQRIQQWIEDDPGRAHAGERMLDELVRIRTEFTGDTAERLEELVDKAFALQLVLDQPRRAELAARERTRTEQDLTGPMSDHVVSVTKSHESVVEIEVGVAKVLARADAKNTFVFKPPTRDKKFLN